MKDKTFEQECMDGRFYNPYGDMPDIPDMSGIDSEKQDELRVKATLMGCASYVVGAVIALLVCALFGGCTVTRIVPVIEQRTDTLLRYSNTRDSIYVHDSIVTTHWGDTVTVERWHTRWRDRWRTDTLYIAKTDSVPKPYPVEVIKKIERKLTWWQQARMHVGGIVIFGLIIFAAVKIVRRKMTI